MRSSPLCLLASGLVLLASIAAAAPLADTVVLAGRATDDVEGCVVDVLFELSLPDSGIGHAVVLLNEPDDLFGIECESHSNVALEPVPALGSLWHADDFEGSWETCWVDDTGIIVIRLCANGDGTYAFGFTSPSYDYAGELAPVA